MDKPGKTVRKKRPRRTFTPEFKAEAVRLCRVGDRSIAQVAKDLDLTETALREWVRRADVDAGKGPAGALTSDERAELARLRREIKQLQMERDAYPITALCRVMQVARSGYHPWAVRE
jgi:transposase-like protein